MRSIYLVLSSSDVTLEWLRRVGAAVLVQLARDVCPAWELAVPSLGVAATMEAVPFDAWPIVLLQDTDVASAMGYHSETPEGRPYARVFTRGASLDDITITISHEAAEAVVDPCVNMWALGPDGILRAVEVCDPVEGDSYSVEPGVLVSNFVPPAWFDSSPPSGARFDHLELVAGPGVCRPGGYISTRSATGPGVLGNREAAARHAAHPASRTARRSR